MNSLEKLANKRVYGAIFGDIIGSRFEWHNRKSKEFTMFHHKSLMTDDSILTLAVMDSFTAGIEDNPEAIIKNVKQWARSYPNSGYGSNFKMWVCKDESKPYGSYGNGAAMRISPVGWYAKTEEEVIKYADIFTNITHNHPEAIKAARCVAMCVFKAKNGASKEEIVNYIKTQYDINFDYDDLVKNYSFDTTCQGSVPQALFCFSISESLEDCARTAVSIGGDSDTIAAISCSIASAFYDDGSELINQTEEFAEELAQIVADFTNVCVEHNK